LIDKNKGQQKVIGEKFTKVYDDCRADFAGLEYTWFDFHAELPKSKYENLSKLLVITDDILKK